MNYNSQEVESKWKNYWKDNKTYKVNNDSDKPKYYVLDMFPYPSGAGLHVGHPLGYIASDIFARYKRMKGFNVLHPMGFDAFGLPAEEYALQTGIHPAVSTKENMVRYREQLASLGFSFDWDREVYTCDPNYYKWTQWIFGELFGHYYDNKTNSAQPISALEKTFETEGNQNISAATEYDEIFSHEDWNAKSAVEKSEILMQYRLAYRKVGYVNWCEELGTVLANDQVKDGVSERGGHPVIQKAMTQWYLRITSYAERLLNDMDTISWSEALKTMQRNWIGRSEGASVTFPLSGHDESIEVFTTRPDTVYGVTYMVLAPEHDLVKKITTADQKEAVETYVNNVKAKSEIERMAEKTVSGVWTGAYAIHPFTNEEIPVWIGEYVLKDYGTGAIMAVPSDDDRDKGFAEKFGLTIIEVVDKSNYPGASLSDKLGVIINSDFLNGMEVAQAITAACQRVEEMGIGKAQINYKLRDANFSRQRYWGEPFPVIYNKEGIPEIVPLNDLPVNLPETDDFKPAGGGKSPLSRMEDWVNLPDGYTRETDVMPAVAGSSWYYLRYMDPQNDGTFVAKEAVDYWQDVDLYVGGAEHAVAHLMYARFWHKFLFDKGLVPTTEPFKRLVNQGMIQGVIEFAYLLKEKENGRSRFLCSGLVKSRDIPSENLVRIPIHVDFVQSYGNENSYLNIESIEKFIAWRPDYADAIFECGKGIYQNGEFTPHGDATDTHLVTLSEVGKMSKSKFNVINPDSVISKYGTDCFRMYEMFLGPIEQAKPWDTQGIDGVSKFIKKLWALFYSEESLLVNDDKASDDELKVLHKTIKKIGGDIENLSMNTAISAFMICVNDLRKLNCSKKEILNPLTRLIAPFAPFIAEEFWKALGEEGSVHHTDFPIHDESVLVESSIEYPICINGKKRTLMTFSADASKDEISEQALSSENVQKYIDGKPVKKVIVVPNRMVNIVV